MLIVKIILNIILCVGIIIGIGLILLKYCIGNSSESEYNDPEEKENFTGLNMIIISIALIIAVNIFI